MMETSTIRDPLVLHFAFAKRQPFVIAGFLDMSEFATLKDFVPQLAVHESLDKMEMGKQDGAAMLAQLLDSEQEDLVEGQKNVIAVHNAGPDDLDLLTSSFKQAWFASTVLPAGDVAKKYKVPVLDLKTTTWVNVHPDAHDTLWARSLMAVHGEDAMGLRMALKGIYHDACQLAASILAGEVAGKAGAVLDKYGDTSTREALIEATTSYFGINARELLQGIGQAPPSQPSRTIRPHPDRLPTASDGIEHPISLPPEAASRTAPAKPVPNRKKATPATKAGGERKDPFTSEYFFLSKNVTFKKALVRVVNETLVAGREFTSPAAKYFHLRAEGAWKGAIPASVLQAVLEAIVAGCKDKQEALGGAKTFQTTSTAFKLAPPDALTTIITNVLALSTLPESRPGKAPLVGGRSWPGMDPPPGEIDALIAWLGQGITKLQGFTVAARQIARQRGLLGAGAERFVPIPLPKPLEQMRGGDLVPWLRASILNLQGWTRQLGAPPMQPAPADKPRDLTIMDAAWKEAGEKLVAGDLEGFVQKAYLSVEKGIAGLHGIVIGKPPAENATLHDQVTALAIKQPRLLLPFTDALHVQRKLRNKVVHDNAKVPLGMKDRAVAFYTDFHGKMASNLAAIASAGPADGLLPERKRKRSGAEC
jgi:hypothetical protein